MNIEGSCAVYTVASISSDSSFSKSSTVPLIPPMTIYFHPYFAAHSRRDSTKMRQLWLKIALFWVGSRVIKWVTAEWICHTVAGPTFDAFSSLSPCEGEQWEGENYLVKQHGSSGWRLSQRRRSSLSFHNTQHTLNSLSSLLETLLEMWPLLVLSITKHKWLNPWGSLNIKIVVSVYGVQVTWPPATPGSSSLKEFNQVQNKWGFILTSLRNSCGVSSRKIPGEL